MRFVSSCLAAAVLSITAGYGADTQDPAQNRAAAVAVLAATPDAPQRWELLDDGALRHKRSGLVCAYKALFDTLTLVKLVAEPDTNVGCSYLSQDGKNHVDVFASKSEPGATTQVIFEVQAKNLVDVDKNAKPISFISDMLVPRGSIGQAFSTVDAAGDPCITLLYTVVTKDWIVWSRATFVDPKPDQTAARVVGPFDSIPFTIGYNGVMGTYP
jgi:hypothetical protein